MRSEAQRATDREYYHKTKERRSELRKKRYSDKQEHIKSVNRNSLLKFRFGISHDIYEEMLKSQNFKCAICETDQKDLDKRLAVDHCHTTGTVRGLLCGSCNRALGLLKDDYKIVNKAKEYLKSNRHF